MNYKDPTFLIFMMKTDMETLTLSTDIQVKRWYPKQAIFTADSLENEFAEKIYERIRDLGIEITETKGNRIGGVKGKTDAEIYRNAKSTLAVVQAPPGQFKLQPIPPSADYQFHLAQGCPAHCQYCYLAGSLKGAPVVRVYGNLPQILENTKLYDQPDRITSFEASCYTDPLAFEHITGSLEESILHFGQRDGAHLRWVTKYDDVASLLSISHNERTRCRFSLNAEDIAKTVEIGVAPLNSRLNALRQMAEHGYPVGIVLAPIIPYPSWEEGYTRLFELISLALPIGHDVTFEFITHRFTPVSKEILNTWYPNSKLLMEESDRATKFNKFGGVKYVYKPEVMKLMKNKFLHLVSDHVPQAKILYWT